MAESDQNRDNPFSFKKFVHKKDLKNDGDERDCHKVDIDIFEIPDTVESRKHDNPKQILVVDEEIQKSKTKKGRKSENPFSFKKFLSGSTEVKSSACDKSRNVDGLEERKSKPQPEGPSSLSYPGTLPDFVQDHYSNRSGGASNLFSLNSEHISEHTELSSDIGDNIRIGPVDSVLTGTQSHCDTYFSEEEDERTKENGSRVNALPDFLSDAAKSRHVLSTCDNDIFKNESGSKIRDITAEDESKLIQLQEENGRLREQLEYLKSNREADAERILHLQQQLTEQKKKEEEETAVMDRAMEQVENNLSETTKRAVQAENTAAKLKQELKNIQADMRALQTENTMLHASDQYVLDVKERTSYVACQLSTASKTAETSLRQLLSGLDQLKLMSQVLESIDKISEEPSSSEQSTSSTRDVT